MLFVISITPPSEELIKSGLPKLCNLLILRFCLLQIKHPDGRIFFFVDCNSSRYQELDSYHCSARSAFGLAVCCFANWQRLLVLEICANTSLMKSTDLKKLLTAKFFIVNLRFSCTRTWCKWSSHNQDDNIKGGGQVLSSLDIEYWTSKLTEFTYSPELCSYFAKSKCSAYNRDIPSD